MSTYSSVHRRLARVRGPARDRACVSCHGQAHEWSLTPGCSRAVFDGHRWFSLDPFDYRPLCCGCHRRADALTRRARCRASPTPTCRYCGARVMCGQKDREGCPAHLSCQEKHARMGPQPTEPGR